MRRVKPKPTRNKLDLADPAQIRFLKKRLGISVKDLRGVVGKVGNSIAAISKEIELQKMQPTVGADRDEIVPSPAEKKLVVYSVA
jgi:hypothetical protein